MADIKDMILNPQRQTKATLAYTLLMANVLGLTIFLDGSGILNRVLKGSQDSEAAKKTASEMGSKEEILGKGLEKDMTRTLKTMEVSPSEVPIPENPKAERSRGNVIDFREAAALRSLESLEERKALVWHFPKK